MKVSIIVPIYNVAQYIHRCLQSIAAQTYHDIECFLIDDCGTDNSMLLVEQFIKQYEGSILFNIIRHQQNRGPSAARNAGIKAATGDYVYFIDSDDAITPDCIELLTGLATRYPEADYIQGEIITGTNDLMKGHTDPDVPEYCDNRRLLEDIILCKTHRTAWNRLIKRSFLIDNSLFFLPGILMEDHLWTYFVSKYAHAVSFSHKGTYYYYNNGNSLVNSPSKASLVNRYSSYITVTDAIARDLLQRNNLQQCHRTYVGEALVFGMINLARLHSLFHWIIFWKFAWKFAWKIRTKITWQRLSFFVCLMPPLCFMIETRGWRWRLRKFVAQKL